MTVHRLQGQVRHYDWGGDRYIAELIDAEPDGRPFAEYWLGAHPDSPSRVRLGSAEEAPLDALINSESRRWLGDDADRFDGLPFLMKVLDVARPLSIQVHPNQAQARAGFQREDAQGIPRDARHRNFRDPNHKPELAVALGPFWLLYGFRPSAAIDAELARFPELGLLRQTLDSGGLPALFERLMRADRDTLARWVLPLYEGLKHSDDPATPDFWIREWLGDADPADRIDRGVFGFLIMNLLQLEAGEGIFQAANVPHAYLRGQIVEIMANSDNVLRCGLTSKHVDPEALLTHVDFSATRPHVIGGDAVGDPMTVEYQCPAEEFVLSRATLDESKMARRAASVEIWLVTEGSCRIEAARSMKLDAGAAVVVEPGTELTAQGEPVASVFIARVPATESH